MTDQTGIDKVIAEVKRHLTSEAMKLLDTRSEWKSVREPTENTTQAVYFIRPVTASAPFGRWLATDDKCILNIGRTSATTGMRGRSRQMAALRHQVTERLSNKKNRIGWQNNKPLDLVYSFCAVESSNHAKLWEALFLLAYYRHFGETPPTNRRLEYVTGGRKKEDQEWMKFLTAFKGFRRLEWQTISEQFDVCPVVM